MHVCSTAAAAAAAVRLCVHFTGLTKGGGDDQLNSARHLWVKELIEMERIQLRDSTETEKQTH